MKKILVLCAVFAFHQVASAETIWEAHSKLVAAEQTTDIQVAPVAAQLMKKGLHTEETMEAAGDARMRLEEARHNFLEAFQKLTAAEKDAFVKELNQRPDAEILIYDIFELEDIGSKLLRIAEIRAEQAEKLFFPFGRGLESNIQPRALPTSVLTIDTNATVEINGSNFDANSYSLTFDDGPLPRTSRPIMETLAEWGVKVNYFQCGNMVASLNGSNANLLSEQFSAGHQIGNHSWDHPQMTKLSLDSAKKQIDDTYSVIERALSAFGYRSPLFRFPYGARNAELKEMIHGMGVTSVMWNIDTLDWKYPDPGTIVDVTKPQIEQQGRGIILMHEIHTQTTLALPSILQILADKGSTLVQLQVRQ